MNDTHLPPQPEKDTRKKFKKMLEDADAKAEALGEDEINARLGPATLMFFNIAESLEYKMAPIFSGFTSKLIILIMGFFVSWLSTEILMAMASGIPLSAAVGAVLFIVGMKTAFKARLESIEIFFYIFWILYFFVGMRNIGGDGPIILAVIGGPVGFLFGWMIALFTIKPQPVITLSEINDEMNNTPTP
jgi:hypothetical protein